MCGICLHSPKREVPSKTIYFGPNRCCHCALVLRQEIRRADSEKQDNVESNNEEASYPESRDFTLHFVQRYSRHHVDIPTRSLNSDHAPTETAEKTFLLSSILFAETNNISRRSCPGNRVHPQNRALIKVFCVYYFVSHSGIDSRNHSEFQMLRARSIFSNTCRLINHFVCNSFCRISYHNYVRGRIQ